MYGSIRGATPYDGRVLVETLAALRSLEQSKADNPTVLGYWPAARSNPYQSLLYADAWESGFAPVALSSPADFETFRAACDGQATPILHLHWTLEVLRGIENELEAEAALTQFIRVLDQFVAAGGKIVWTIHNVLPHDCRFPELEARLQQEIVERSIVVHVLTRSTSEAVADQFEIPASKIVHVAHPNYIDAYPNLVSRQQARFDIGVEEDQIVYTLLGAIKPYKGLEELLQAFDVLSAEDPGKRVLVVAGKPDADGSVDELLVQCEMNPYVHLRAERVSDVDLQRYLNAADIAVLPYRRSLNSGVLLLAMSFGLPAIVPALSSTREVITEDFAVTFDPGHSDDLLRAMRTSDRLLNPAARAAARARAEAFNANTLSAHFFSELRLRLA